MKEELTSLALKSGLSSTTGRFLLSDPPTCFQLVHGGRLDARFPVQLVRASELNRSRFPRRGGPRDRELTGDALVTDDCVTSQICTSDGTLYTACAVRENLGGADLGEKIRVTRQAD